MAENISNNSKDNNDEIMMYENNQRNYFNNQYFKRKRNKSQGEHLQYLKIKLYRNGKFTTDFTPRLINSRYNDDFENHDEFKIYYTEIDGHNLKFLKSHISKRWWVQYVDDRIVSVKNNLIPCSKNDFKLSQQGIISDRILKRMRNKFV